VTSRVPAGGGADAQRADAQLAAREEKETADLLRRELAAMEDDLRSLERHVGHLEHGRLVLEIEIAQLRARSAELFADLERDEMLIATLRRELAAAERAQAGSSSARTRREVR
jgi:predicted nuclease with TOPRIM domain